MFNFTKTPMKSEQTGQYLTFKLSRRNSHNAPFSTQKELRKAFLNYFLLNFVQKCVIIYIRQRYLFKCLIELALKYADFHNR